jgi:hypothetical protein
MPPIYRAATLALLLVSTAGSPAEAQPEPEATRVVQAVRTTSELRIDGRLDEEAWAAAPVASDFVQQRPQPGAVPSERTEVRLLYDDRNLYVGMRMYDARPDSIAAQLGRRDATGLYSDWAHVVIDSYFDRRTAFRFSATPRGVVRDVMHFDDTNEDGGWNAVWEVATSLDSLGWTAEFRIPFSQLRFSTDGRQELRWGINFIRDIARRDERSYWSPILPEVPGLVSRFGELHGLAGIPAPRRMEIVPYALGRLSRVPGDPADPYFRSNDLGRDVGVDLMYGLGALTLNATLNPDFGQVEVDPAVVNLSAFETFYPERRPFFLEGADIFRFGINVGDGGPETLFYTRRIGRAPQGGLPADARFASVPSASRILGAGKLSGKPAGWSVGALGALTARERAEFHTVGGDRGDVVVAPLTGYWVGRLSRDFAAGRSGIGGMATALHRETHDNLRFLTDRAYSGGLDARHRFGDGNYQLEAWVSGSAVHGDTLAIQRLQRAPGRYFQRPDAQHLTYDPARTEMYGAAADVSVARIGGGNWRYGAMAHLKSPGFEVNDLGFQQSADLSFVAAYAGRISFQPRGAFRNWGIFGNTYHGFSTGREHLLSGVNLNGNFELTSGWSGWLGAEHALPALSTDLLRGGPAIRTAPRTNWWGGLNTDRRKPMSLSVGVNGNQRHESGGYFLGITPSVSARPSPRLNLSMGPSLSRNVDPAQWVALRSVGGEPEYVFARIEQTTVSLNTRLNATFTPRLTLELFAQPFVSAGDYSDFKRVDDPRGRRFADRFHQFGPGEIRMRVDTLGEPVLVQGRRMYDVLRGGTAAYSVADPSFNVRSLRGNAVLRWEYRPGSTLFLVWQQQRSGFEPIGDFRFGRDAGAIFSEPPSNVFLVKASWWVG